MRLFCRVIIFLIVAFIFCIYCNLLIAEDSQNKRVLLKPVKNCNIVLIFIDTLRADHLSCYGYSRKTSPNLDKLSKESFVFEQNFATASYTLASFMSISTSLYPKAHGVFEIYKDKLSPRILALAQVLQMYGYETAWFGPWGAPHLDPEVGFGRGFNYIDYSYDRAHLDKEKRDLCDWLDRNKDKNFFLNFHTYKVHEPYFPSLKYKQKFTKDRKIEGVIEDEKEYWEAVYQFMINDKEKAAELMGRGLWDEFVASGLLDRNFQNNKEQIARFFTLKRTQDRFTKVRQYVYWRGINLNNPLINAHIQALYDANILEFDEEIIGVLIDKLRAMNLYNKTIIIIYADHGEEFYEHGGYGHGETLYDELIHVPLIMRVPWIKEGKRVKELTQTVDIMPTLLDLLGIPIPHQAQGKSLVPFIEDRKSSPIHDYVFGQLIWASYIRSKEWKFFFTEDGRRELYHIVKDPKERKNVYLENKDIALRMELALKQWEASLPSYKDQEYSYPSDIDKAAQERIRKTGYW